MTAVEFTIDDGNTPVTSRIPGVDRDNVVTAHDVLASMANIEGQRVAVLGQFSTGAETANYLAEKGNTVVIVARSPAECLAQYNGPLLGARIELIFSVQRNESITIMNGWDVREIRAENIVIVDKEGNEQTLEIDKVVLARGVVPVAELAEQMEGRVPEVYVIGDAAGPRDIAAAMYEGALVAHRI